MTHGPSKGGGARRAFSLHTVRSWLPACGIASLFACDDAHAGFFLSGSFDVVFLLVLVCHAVTMAGWGTSHGGSCCPKRTLSSTFSHVHMRIDPSVLARVYAYMTTSVPSRVCAHCLLCSSLICFCCVFIVCVSYAKSKRLLERKGFTDREIKEVSLLRRCSSACVRMRVRIPASCGWAWMGIFWCIACKNAETLACDAPVMTPLSLRANTP